MKKAIVRVLRYTVIILNIIAALLLLLSYLALYVNPADFWLFAPLGLLYPLLLAINVVFLLYWLIRWRPLFFLSASVVALGIPVMVVLFRFRIPSPPFDGPRDITVLSYNVNLFHLYAWSEKEPTMLAIDSLVREQKADIVCFQEFYVDEKRFTEEFAKTLFGENAHIHYIVDKPNSRYGIATFSRYPIVASGEIHFEGSANASMFTDLLVEEDTIRVYNNHLQSFRFKPRNLSFMRNPNFRKEAEPFVEILDLSSRMREAIQKRAVQVLQVREHIEKSPYPVIVCGDFNDSPISYTYRHMRGDDLSDAFVTAGDGFGATYDGLFPSFRIDYILHSKVFTALDFTVLDCSFSDHFPIVAPFSKDKKEPEAQ